MDKRISKIKELKKQGKTLEEIGLSLKPALSAERVRQILHPEKRLRCKVHGIFYSKICRYCVVESAYVKVLENPTEKVIENEIARLSAQDRSKEKVLQRAMLIKYLKDTKGMSKLQIAKLLRRDHTSVSNLYEKKI